jgi:septal ring factor EnvC (AmiA/AmiB activator)
VEQFTTTTTDLQQCRTEVAHLRSERDHYRTESQAAAEQLQAQSTTVSLLTEERDRTTRLNTTNNDLLATLRQQLEEQTTQNAQLSAEIAAITTETEAAQEEASEYAFALDQAYRLLQQY